MPQEPPSHSGPQLGARNGFDVIDCEQCGFAHATPIPSEKELRELYEHEYYATEKPDYLTIHQEDRAWWEMVYARRYELLEARLPATQRRILDIGSGPGTFLRTGKTRGWEVKGIDPSRQAAEYCQQEGLDVMNAFYGPKTAAEFGQFDAVNLSFVLEHIPDPAALLMLVKGNLNGGGLLSIEVPNDFSPFQLTLRDHHDFDPWWVVPPHHLNYFSFDSLAGLVERCGFEVLHTEATFPIDLFLLMGENYIGDSAVGRSCHKRRVAFEMSMHQSGQSALLSQMYADFAKRGIGREVVLIARKVS